MSQVLITGATGLVGGHLLRMLINTPQVSAIAAPPADGYCRRL